MPDDILDKIKSIDETVTKIDDIWKVENEENFKNIVNLIIETNMQESIDPAIEMVSNILSQDFNAADFKEIYNLIVTNIFSISKTSTEFDPKERIKFIQVANVQPDDNNYFGICDIKQSSIPKGKTSNDLAAQLMAKKILVKKMQKVDHFLILYFQKKFILLHL